MLKFIRFNSLIGEIGIVWDGNTKLLKQVILPERTTQKTNPAQIAFQGVIEETSLSSDIFQIMSDIKDVILGNEVTFDVKNFDFSDMTDFQRSVLIKQSEIPYGKVITYKRLAQLIDKPKSARPVANVLANNRFPLVIPCHRTVRSDWTVGGYAGSNDGYFKKFILEHEGIEIVDDVISKKYRYLEDEDMS